MRFLVGGTSIILRVQILLQTKFKYQKTLG